MDLEPTVDQFCSGPSSVKLKKDVKNDLLKRAAAKLADRPLSVGAMQLHLWDFITWMKIHAKDLAASTTLSILRSSQHSQDTFGRLKTEGSAELR